MAAEIRYGDVGAQFNFTITKADGSVEEGLATATSKTVIFTKPNGTSITKDLSLTTDGTDGKVYYVTVEGDLDVVGIWRLQVAFTLSGGNHFKTNIRTFKVHANL